MNDPESAEGISVFKEVFADRLVNEGNPIILSGDVEKDATSFKEGLDQMKETYNTITEEDVKPAFMKFDTDESGAIDKSELQQLSKALGFPLTD